LQAPQRSIWASERAGRKETLLYGRMFLPDASLEALYLRRLSLTQQLRLMAVSDSRLKNNGTMLAVLQNDFGKHSHEVLYSTDEALIGVRGLYNFGPDPRNPPAALTSKDRYGRLSIGGELYYGVLNKSGGLSTGMRFTTLPAHTGVPLTMTLTANPLMGNLSSTYAVKAGKALTLCSRLDFNVYSYESSLVVGCELWRAKKGFSLEPPVQDSSKGPRVLTKIGEQPTDDYPDPSVMRAKNESVAGVLRARMDQNLKAGLLWEGRIKDLLFSAGTNIDFKSDNLFKGIGFEVAYAS
jgi:distribution and morphology protein 10